MRPGSTPPETEAVGSLEEGDGLRRPESSPPVLLSSQNILIPGSSCRESESDLSPLDHYVHTDSKLDGEGRIEYKNVTLYPIYTGFRRSKPVIGQIENWKKGRLLAFSKV